VRCTQGGQDASLGMQLRQGPYVNPKAVPLALPWMRSLPAWVQSVRGVPPELTRPTCGIQGPLHPHTPNAIYK
jgi:hypothetical protein